MKRFLITQTLVAEVEVPDHITEDTIDEYLGDTTEGFPEKMEVDSTTYTEIQSSEKPSTGQDRESYFDDQDRESYCDTSQGESNNAQS
jgi:hypothetical protein